MKPGPLISLFGIAVITVVGAAYLTFGVVRYNPSVERTHATLVLKDSAGLLAGSPILLRGVEIGEITEVHRAGQQVEVGLAVDPAYRLPADSDLYIETLSALGEPYVVFTPSGTGGATLREGQVLTGDRVHAPLSIPEVARLITTALDQLDPAVLDRLITTAETALHGTDTLVPRLARASDLIAAMLTSRSATFGALLANLQRVAPDMDWMGPSFSTAAPRFTEFGERVSQIAAAVQRLINTGDTPAMYVENMGLVPFLDRLTGWIREAGPEIEPYAPMLAPLAASTAESVPQMDLSALIASAAAATAPSGSLHLRVGMK
ncbi:MlaD family protein [Nocardia thailandica]